MKHYLRINYFYQPARPPSFVFFPRWLFLHHTSWIPIHLGKAGYTPFYI